jgi:hypothetical protein
MERTGKMNDTHSLCSRCAKPINDAAFGLSLERESHASVPKELRLCARCAISFELWYQKRVKTSANSGRRDESAGAPGVSTGSHSSPSKRSRKQTRKQIYRAMIVASATSVVFAFAFYWTWSILKAVTRVE